MAELISLYGDNHPARLLWGNLKPLTFRQRRMKRKAERLGFIPIDSIIQGASAITNTVVGAIASKNQQQRETANQIALQKQAELAAVRQAQAINAMNNSSVSTSVLKPENMKTILTIGIPVALFGLTMFLKSRKKR